MVDERRGRLAVLLAVAVVTGASGLITAYALGSFRPHPPRPSALVQGCHVGSQHAHQDKGFPSRSLGESLVIAEYLVSDPAGRMALFIDYDTALRLIKLEWRFAPEVEGNYDDDAQLFEWVEKAVPYHPTTIAEFDGRALLVGGFDCAGAPVYELWELGVPEFDMEKRTLTAREPSVADLQEYTDADGDPLPHATNLGTSLGVPQFITRLVKTRTPEEYAAYENYLDMREVLVLSSSPNPQRIHRVCIDSAVHEVFSCFSDRALQDREEFRREFVSFGSWRSTENGAAYLFHGPHEDEESSWTVLLRDENEDGMIDGVETLRAAGWQEALAQFSDE